MVKNWKVSLCALLLGGIFLTTACGKETNLVQPKEEVPTAAEILQLEQEALSKLSSTTMEATLYYQDASGYLVPVHCRIPQSEGVARATLSHLVSTADNDAQAANYGLYTTLPSNLTLDIDLKDAVATVSLSGEANQCEDALQESNMVSSIVQTLTEFDTIEKVRFLLNGEKVSALQWGTDLSADYQKEDVNVESVDAAVSLSGAGRVNVYFESEASGAMVPVSRTVFSREDLDTAVLELLHGPKEGSGLRGCIPKGTGLLWINKGEDGVVHVNLTKEFEQALMQADGGKQALKALVLTCSQFPGVSSVKVYVEGEPFDMSAVSAMVSLHKVNTEEEMLFSSLGEE